MVANVDIRSIEVLADLRAALVKFHHDAEAAVNAATAEGLREVARLQQAVARRQAELRRANEALTAARAALTACLNSGYTDSDGHYHGPSCGAQEAQVVRAQRALAAAEEALRLAQQMLRAVSEVMESYTREARGFTGLLGDSVPKATARLDRSQRILEDYVSGALANALVGFSAAMLGVIAASRPTVGDWVSAAVSDVSNAVADIPEPASRIIAETVDKLTGVPELGLAFEFVHSAADLYHNEGLQDWLDPRLAEAGRHLKDATAQAVEKARELLDDTRG